MLPRIVVPKVFLVRTVTEVVTKPFAALMEN